MPNQSHEIWAVIPAAGSGKRMQSELPKQYLPLAGASVLDVTLNKILALHQLSGLVVALGEGDSWWSKSRYAKHPLVHVCAGGKERSDSVLNALVRVHSLTRSADEHLWVLVHDAARPCVTGAKIADLLRVCLASKCGGILSAPVADTLKRINAEGKIVSTEDRSHLWQAHTPQVFPYGQLRSALEYCRAKGLLVTDEASAVEQCGGEVIAVPDRRDNIKITMPEDLGWAEHILMKQHFSMS